MYWRVTAAVIAQTNDCHIVEPGKNVEISSVHATNQLLVSVGELTVNRTEREENTSERCAESDRNACRCCRRENLTLAGCGRGGKA
jgi:hypothetical protein